MQILNNYAIIDCSVVCSFKDKVFLGYQDDTGKQCQVITISDRMTTLCYDCYIRRFAFVQSVLRLYNLLNPVSILLKSS